MNRDSSIVLRAQSLTPRQVLTQEGNLSKTSEDPHSVDDSKNPECKTITTDKKKGYGSVDVDKTIESVSSRLNLNRKGQSTKQALSSIIKRTKKAEPLSRLS